MYKSYNHINIFFSTENFENMNFVLKTEIIRLQYVNEFVY